MEIGKFSAASMITCRHVPDPHVLLSCPQVLISQGCLYRAAVIEFIICALEGELAALFYQLIDQGHVGITSSCAGALSSTEKAFFHRR